MTQSLLVYSVEDLSGDALIKLPFVAGLRAAFPDAHIAWCAATGRSVFGDWLKPIVTGLVDELILGEPVGLGALDVLLARRPFGGRRFDLVIDTQANLRRSVVIRRAAAGGFVSAAAKFVLSSARPVRPWPSGMAAQLEALLKLAAGEAASSRPVSLLVPEAIRAARALLPSGPTYVGFAPGAGGADRRWPLERYLALAGRQQLRGRTAVFFLGPAETDYVPIVRAEAPWARLPLQERVGMQSPVEGPLLTIALAARLSAAVAADAGPGHMLAAGGVPLVSLFRERRKARKFAPAAREGSHLVAEDYGATDLGAIPEPAVDTALEALLARRPLSESALIMH